MADLESAGPTFKSTLKTSQEKFVSDLIQCRGLEDDTSRRDRSIVVLNDVYLLTFGDILNAF
jgi:hypothetical protein